ncbi:MAG: sugar ABC transporter permease [Spirochaetaceae bacterium]|nr:MAG: sugar ABC transporter permease [Spirochaetaceae bacterium]
MIRRRIVANYDLYLFVLPAALYFLIFHYGPIYGLQIAFKEFSPVRGITGSLWVGFEHFQRFFTSYHFWNLIRNTLGISVYQLVVGFPAPIILALMLNEVRNRRFKRVVQTVTYAPHFISVVVMTGMILIFLRSPSGIVNHMIVALGGEPVRFMVRAEYFKTIYVLSEVWQRTGWGSIVYLAALSGIDPQIYEAAIIDGATRLQRVRHINIPGILPIIIILLILNTGQIMSVGFEKVFLLQNPLILSTSEVISTYVYKSGLQNFQYSFAAAVGLVNSVINFLLLVSVNTIARRTGETGLW